MSHGRGIDTSSLPRNLRMRKLGAGDVAVIPNGLSSLNSAAASERNDIDEGRLLIFVFIRGFLIYV